MNVLTHILATTPQTFWLPRGTSNLATDVDWAWHIILYTTGFFFCVVIGAMTFFILRFRRRTPTDVTSTVTHNTPLEITWTFVPLVIVLIFFYIGFKGFLNYDTPRSDSAIVDVTGQKWFFTFGYPNGASAPDLYCVVNKPVRLDMHSNDVLHALYLPNFRVQRNLVPGRQTTIWFIPTETSPAAVGNDPGGWPIFCTQYCGNGHSKMGARVHVLTQADYDVKMTELANPFKKKVNGKSVWVPYKEVGERLYNEVGCKSCHNVTDTTAGLGPTWWHLWKRPHEFWAVEPRSVIYNGGKPSLQPTDSDEKWDAYLNESILDPDAVLVHWNGENKHGMTQFKSILDGSTQNVEKRRALIEYIKSLHDDAHPYNPAVNPKDNPDLFDADNPKLFDENHNAVHPESLAGIKARQGGASTGPAVQ